MKNILRSAAKIPRDILITHEREKLINAIIYFAKNTRFLGKTKLCKLLYFLDFEHFKETGRTVTGLDYFAWKMGPVPVELYEEIDMPEPDLAEKVGFAEKPTRRGAMLVFKPIAGFDDSHFTRRELRILKGLAAEFRDAQADDMIETTHLENQPWHKYYEFKDSELLQRHFSGDINRIGLLADEITIALMECALQSEDISPRQTCIVQTALHTFRASPTEEQ